MKKQIKENVIKREIHLPYVFSIICNIIIISWSYKELLRMDGGTVVGEESDYQKTTVCPGKVSSKYSITVTWQCLGFVHSTSPVFLHAFLHASLFMNAWHICNAFQCVFNVLFNFLFGPFLVKTESQTSARDTMRVWCYLVYPDGLVLYNKN